MENVVGLVGLLPLSRCDTDDSAFRAHLPNLFSFFKGCQVSLAILVNNAEESFICKQSAVCIFSRTQAGYLCRLGITMAEHSSLGVCQRGHLLGMNEHRPRLLPAFYFLERHESRHLSDAVSHSIPSCIASWSAGPCQKLWHNQDLVALGKMRGYLLGRDDELSLTRAFLVKAMLVVFQGVRYHVVQCVP